MGWIGDAVDSVKSVHIRQVLSQVVSLGLILASALIFWKGLTCIAGSEPVTVVLSGSMEPGFLFKGVTFCYCIWARILFVQEKLWCSMSMLIESTI